MDKCYDCPRNCGVTRNNQKGYCREGDKIRVSKIIENFMWEEPCISAKKGTLALFFSGCNLRCEFCQNYQISHIGSGSYYTAKEFKDLILSFDLSEYDGLELITPTHFSSILCKSFEGLKLPIPVVWNSGGYEKPEILEKIANFVDVFLPDLKFFDTKLSEELACAPNYFEVAKNALLAMRKLKPVDKFENGVMKEGLLIRHLVLPGHTDDSVKLLEFVSENLPNTMISLMGQFTPLRGRLNKRLKPLEYKLVLSKAESLGLSKGYFQELDSASEKFIPQF